MKTLEMRDAMLLAELPILGLAVAEEAVVHDNHSYIPKGGAFVRIHWAKTPTPEQVANATAIIDEQEA